MLPDLPTLVSGLKSALSNHGLIDGEVEIIDRQFNEYAAGSPSEIVTCRLADGNDLRLLLKYQFEGESWSDTAYEAEVYRHLLHPLQVGAPAFYGAHREEHGRAWLVLEYLDDGVSLMEMADEDTIASVAAWLGRFHAASEAHLTSPALSFLKVYDVEYYRAAARRTLQLAAESHHALPWLAELGHRFEELIVELCASQPTITHGDFHLSNLLWRDEIIYPLDWEMAGISAGEIDLVSLTDGWPEIEPRCALEYQGARWPDGAPLDFERRLKIARLALCFYKLSSRPNWTSEPDSIGDRESLLAMGEQLGVI